MAGRRPTPRDAWIVALDVVVLLPLLGALAGPASHGVGALVNLSTGLGLLATSTLAVVVLVASRVRGLTRLLGVELGTDLHRRLGVATLVLVVAHVLVAVAASPTGGIPLHPDSNRGSMVAGAGALLLMLVGATLLVPRSSTRRRALVARLHGLAALLVVVLVVVHVGLLGRLAADPLAAVPLAALALVVLGVLGYRWVGRPLLGHGAYRVRAVRPETASASTVVLAPVGLRREPRAEPGQFVWLRLRRDATLAAEHPFTVAATCRSGELELTVRHGGPFTRELVGLPSGAPVWVDGPHGSFVPPLPGAAPGGLVLIAGGVGITPIMSILRAHAASADPRAHRLLLAARAGEDLFTVELAALSRRLDLAVLRTEGGRLDPPLVVEVLPDEHHAGGHDYFVCGPPRLVGAALEVLDVLGVPDERIRTEQFG